MTTLEMLARLGTGVGLGALIGVERQYRARMAGLRTNALVAVGATLFVLLSAHGFGGLSDTGSADPTRVAAQIVSGIGFLGAGVIMRDGFNVRGLNTAATLWCAAAVGALAGAGLYEIAAVGTAVVLAANIVLRWLGRAVDRQPQAGEEITTYYTFLAVARTTPRRTCARCSCSPWGAPTSSCSRCPAPTPPTQATSKCAPNSSRTTGTTSRWNSRSPASPWNRR